MTAGASADPGQAADAAPPEVDPRFLERARALLRRDVGAQSDWPASADEALRLGWALKAACYETWNTEPTFAERAARLSGELAQVHALPVLRALAAWTRGIAELGAGRMAPAIGALDDAARDFASLGDPAHAAQTQVPKLMALSVLGRHGEALQCAEATLAQFVATGDERSAGKIELNLGTMLFRQDRHAEACRHYRSAAQRFARVGDLEQSIMADIGLANALTWRFEFDEALQASERARRLADEHGFRVLSAQARGSIGQLELHRGEPQRALPELAAACRLFEEAGGLPQRLAEAEIALADAYLAVHLLPEAVALYDRVAERCARHDMPAEQARARAQRAQALQRLGDAAGARADLGVALPLFEAQGNAASAALVRLHLADLALRDGDPADALRGAIDAAAQFDAQAIPGWRCEAEVLAAEASAAAGDAVGARHRFEAARALPGATSHTEWRCRLGLAALDHAAGRRDAGLAQLEQALADVEVQRAALPGDEFRTAFGTDKAAAHDRCVAWALEALDANPASAPSAESLWRSLECARSRALVLGLARGDVAGGDAVEALRTRLQWTRRQAREALAGGDAGPLAELDREARSLEQQLLEVHRQAQAAAAAAEVVTPPRAEASLPSLQALCAMLDEHEAWVEYHRLDERWIAAVVTRRQVRWCRGDAAGLDARLQSLRFQLEALRGATPTLLAHAAQLHERAARHLKALHRQLWSPLQEALDGAERVYLAPHRDLHYVPFAALHDGRGWLVERHELVHVPSAAAWAATRSRRPDRFDRLVALGVGGPQLPHVEAEVRAVARQFGSDATVLLDDAATLPALRAAAPAGDVVHLACHGQFRADSPYFSSLHLADGELTLRDAAALPLTASLVTLSACETGLSRIAAGDELVGLVRGFLLAGASRVLATLWTVDDASTAALMQDFYTRLRAGQRPGAALRAAQAAFATAGRHPFHWAAFTLHGGA